MLLDSLFASLQLGLVNEEVSRRGGEQQAEGLGVDEEIEPHLGRAPGSETTRYAGAVGVVERTHTIERATARLSIPRRCGTDFLSLIRAKTGRTPTCRFFLHSSPKTAASVPRHVYNSLKKVGSVILALFLPLVRNRKKSRGSHENATAA